MDMFLIVIIVSFLFRSLLDKLIERNIDTDGIKLMMYVSFFIIFEVTLFASCVIYSGYVVKNILF